ncbi:MAG: hypothetical protein WDM79_01470 [Terricaulis sp.]
MVIDAFGQPVDGAGPLPQGMKPAPRPRSTAAGAMAARAWAAGSIWACARSIFSPRFAVASAWACLRAPGVGKSVLLSMLARGAAADVIVIGLVGERGREVQRVP